MFVVFIHGPAASGKHTIGSILAARLEVPLFHNHLAVDAARSLFEFGSAPFRRLRADIWRSAFTASAQAGQSFVFTFHPEATVEPELIDELTGVVEQSGGRVYFVELVCARSSILSRLANESRQRFGKLVDPGLYQAIEAEGGFHFREFPAPAARIDTDANEPEQAASRIAEAITRRQGRERGEPP